jgi:hypothetical protein
MAENAQAEVQQNPAQRKARPHSRGYDVLEAFEPGAGAHPHD